MRCWTGGKSSGWGSGLGMGFDFAQLGWTQLNGEFYILNPFGLSLSKPTFFKMKKVEPFDKLRANGGGRGGAR
ncbi:hypothetical protein TomTYG45_12030 [Sphingobium sp. TomTYG45]